MKLLNNTLDRLVLGEAMSRSFRKVNSARHILRRNDGDNITVGTEVRRGSKGQLEIGETGQVIAEGNRMGDDGFGRGRVKIEGADAILVSLPTFAKKGYLTRSEVQNYQSRSRQLGGVPFFVLSPSDGVITLIESGFDPMEVVLYD